MTQDIDDIDDIVEERRRKLPLFDQIRLTRAQQQLRVITDIFTEMETEIYVNWDE